MTAVAFVPSLLGRIDLDAASLWREHPPRMVHHAKEKLLELAGGLARAPRGTLLVSRWGLEGSSILPEVVPASASFDGPYDYAASTDGDDSWWVNFANAHLFCAYGMAAFAQDELQVAEHPVLGSLRERLDTRRIDGLPPLTRDGARPTPILIRGAERWCAIDTDPDLAMPYGIYGRRLDRATDAMLGQAVTRLPPGMMSNVLAMEAPQGRGRYLEEEIQLVLDTALVGFAAARLESAIAAQDRRVVIHTGHWGTGAYGGDRVLMAAAQLISARFAGVDGILYHSLDDDGVAAFEKGKRLATRLTRPGMSVEEAANALAGQNFDWGVSDGN